jgi:TonB-linked SusC/RagA family outer membrane protein
MKNKLKCMIFFVVAICCFITSTSYAQSQNLKKISGKVIDANNEPIIGATVIIDGTTTGIVTNVAGSFELTAPVGSTIKVTYIGFSPYQEKISGTKNVYQITLTESSKSLDEVVVVGYGSQKRSELTGSITSVNANDIKDFSSSSVAESLGTMAAGVMVTNTDGTPGATADIIIRGAGSVNGMLPLYIVDGVKQTTGFEFNMLDVESMEVLKDAGSCAIYGAEAAGGVILITTKHGSKGKTVISASARYGVRNITSNIKLLNTADFIRARKDEGSDILSYEGVTGASQLPDVNWMNVMYQTGIEQEYNISISGSTEKVNFFMSGGYLNEKGVFLDTGADRFSFRTNIDYKFNRHITVGENLYGNLRTNNPATPYSIYTNAIPFRTVPTMQPVDAQGNYSPTPSYLNGPNLYGIEKTYHQKDNNYSLNALAYININFVKGLDLRINASGGFYGFSRNDFSEAFNFRAVTSDAFMDAFAGTSQDLIFNATLTFDRTFGNHGIKLMVGTEAEKYDAYNTTMHAIDFPIPLAESIDISTNKNKIGSDFVGVGRSQSFFGRLNYSYLGKYLLTANIRRDGSDKFGPNNRWGTFPSINGAWRINEESFIKDNFDWISNAKVRASWGILGNDGISQFLYQQSYTGNYITYSYGGGAQQEGWAAFTVPNTAIKWEEVHQTDVGIDLGFFNNRMSVVYDYYNRQTKDMLYEDVVPLASGIGYYTSIYTQMPVNLGQVQNIGHEITLSWNDRKGGFNYTISGNVSFNANKVINLGVVGAAPLIYGINRTQNGLPMGLFYGYKAIGIFQNQAQVDAYNAKAVAKGQPYYWKQNTGVGDLIFDDFGQGYVNSNSQTYIGNPWPKAVYGFNMKFEYKGFDLGLQLQAAVGFDIYNSVKGGSSIGLGSTQTFANDGNTTKAIFNDSFFGTNGLTNIPRAGMFDSNNQWLGDVSENYTTTSSFWVEKGDYLKLKNLVIGYSLPKTLMKNAGISNTRIYFSAQNVFTITNYSGIDPEIAAPSSTGAVSVLQRGVDTPNRYLPSRLFSVGIDLSF